MSGGSMDYLCYKVQNEAKSLMLSRTPHRKAFGKLLSLVADALHDIEWRDSGDSSEKDEIESVMKCITHAQILNAFLEDAKETVKRLQDLIDKSDKG